MPAKTVDVHIYEVRWDDAQAVKGSNAWIKRLKTLETQAVSFSKSFEKAFHIKPPKLPDFKTELEKIGDDFDDLRAKSKRTWEGIGQSAFSAIGVIGQAASVVGDILKPIADFGVDIVKNSADLESAMTGVKRTANLTDEQVTKLTAAVRDLSTEELRGSVNAKELGQILEVAGQRGALAGDKFEESLAGTLKFTEEIAKASKALDLSFSATASALGKLQGPFGNASVEVGFLANSINVLADSTKAAAPSIIQIAQKAAPALAAFRVGQGDLIGFSAALDSMGVSSFTASTALQSAFKAMTQKTSAFAEAFGINSKEFNRLVQTDISGAMVMLLEHINTMATETPAGTQKVSQALKDLGVAGAGVSTALLGMASMGESLVTDFLDPANEGLTNMNSINAEFINSIGTTNELWSAFQTILDNTTGIIGDSLLPVLKTLLLDINNQAIAFREWFKESNFVTELLPSALTEIQSILSDLVSSAIKFFKEFDFSQASQDALDFVENMDWRDLLNDVLSIAQKLFTFMVDTLPDVLDLIESFSEALGAIDAIASPLFLALKVGFTGLVDQIKLPFEVLGGFVDLLGKAGGAVSDFFNKTEQQAPKAIEQIESMNTSIKDMTPLIKSADKEMTGNSLLPDTVSWGDKATQSISGLNSQIGQMSSTVKTANAALNTNFIGEDRPFVDTTQSQQAKESMGFVQRSLSQAQQTAGRFKPVAQRQEGLGGFAATQAPAQTPARVTNINLSSQMMMTDNSSQNKLIRAITNVQQKQQARTVGGSTGGSYRVG